MEGEIDFDPLNAEDREDIDDDPVIEDMPNLYDGMQEEINTLKEEIEKSKDKESMIEAEEIYKEKNEEVIKSKKHDSLVSQERIKTLIEDRVDAQKDYFKLKERYDSLREDLESIRKELKDELQRHGANLNKLKETEAALNKTREEKEEIQRQFIVKEEQLRQREQAIEDLEQQAERLREAIDPDKNQAEREQRMRDLDERLRKLEALKQQKDKLERELGLTRREKIIRYLKRAGMGIAAAGAIASIITLIINAVKGTGAAVKKVGRQVTNLGKKMASALPGLLGSVLSLIFRTGGELLKFLGNNIWILVVALGAVILKSLTDKR